MIIIISREVMDEDMWRAKWLSKDRRIIIKGPWGYELKIKSL